MDAAVRRLKILKLGCFAHTLNLGAQKAYSVLSVSKWAAKIRTIIVWMRKSSAAKVVLKEKQQLLSLQPHELVFDVKTRWNSTYLMIERFVEQYPAIQATVRDPRVRKGAEKDKLERMSDEDFKKADKFIKLMRILYTSTLAVSSEKTPTCGQILPILKKFETHFTAADDNSVFTAFIKDKIWSDLSSRYQDGEISAFLEGATIMDPRFKAKMDNNAAWDRVKDAAVKMAGPEESEHQLPIGQDGEDGERETIQCQEHISVSDQEEEENVETQSHPPKKMKITPLEKEAQTAAENICSLSCHEKAEQEIKLYRNLPPVSMSTDPARWWWEKRSTLPILSDLSATYMCVQASSTPSERVFSVAGDTISQERCRIRPEKADMFIFLQKNC